jgi:hypothetical protein
VAAVGQLDPEQRNDRRMFHKGSYVGATSAPLTGLHLVSFVRHNGFNSARGIWTPLPARTRVRQPRESDARRFHKRRRRCAGVTRCGRRLEPEAPWTERTLCAWRALSTREGAAAARPGFRGRSDTRRSGLPVGCSHPPVQCAGHTGLRRCPWRLVCEARSAAGCPRHDRTTARHASSKASVTRAQTCRRAGRALDCDDRRLILAAVSTQPCPGTAARPVPGTMKVVPCPPRHVARGPVSPGRCIKQCSARHPEGSDR